MAQAKMKMSKHDNKYIGPMKTYNENDVGIYWNINSRTVLILQMEFIIA